MRGRILVVDDEAEIVLFLKEFLERQHYEVRALTDSREGLTVYRTFSPDLSILDFRMPFVSGSVLLDQIKEADPGAEVIFLTAQNETTLAVELIKRGAFDYLLKPVDLEKLAIAVSRALEHRRLVKKSQ